MVRRTRSTPWWGWLLVAVLTPLCVLGLTYGFAIVSFALATCGNEPLDVHDMHRGQQLTAIMCAVDAVPWLVAAWWARRSVVVVTGAAICTAHALLVLGYALFSDTWSNGFCF